MVAVFEDIFHTNIFYLFSTHLIRKYRDTNIKILENDLKNENIILLDCIIESIKE